jgi:predicted metal-binding membrane protein
VAALRRIGRRPTLWVELGIAAAWIALILGSTLARGSSPTSGWANGALWVCEIGAHGNGGGGGHMGGNAGLDGGSLLAGTPMWVLMATAMMVPASMPAVSHVGSKSLFWRRRRATVEFLAVFLALWIAFGAAVLGPLSNWRPAGSPYALAAALALAALWQLTPLKRKAMLACHRSRPLPPRGWRASAGVADFALHNGSACVASCWAMMLAVSAAGPASLLWMGGMTGVMAAEKVAEKPQTASRRVAALLTAAACGVVLAALVG